MASAILPARPLAVVVARMVERAERESDDHTRKARTQAYKDLTVNPRTYYAWEHGYRATVSLAVADRVLSRSPYLWFDVWPECTEHEPDPSCAVCVGYFRARFAFTGARIPYGFGRTG